MALEMSPLAASRMAAARSDAPSATTRRFCHVLIGLQQRLEEAAATPPQPRTGGRRRVEASNSGRSQGGCGPLKTNRKRAASRLMRTRARRSSNPFRVSWKAVSRETICWVHGRSHHNIQTRHRIANWLPLVDALRTLLLVPSPEVREILDHRWAHRYLVRSLASEGVVGGVAGLGDRHLRTGASRSRTVSRSCSRLSTRLRTGPIELECRVDPVLP
jgi:hypothetical protein